MNNRNSHYKTTALACVLSAGLLAPVLAQAAPIELNPHFPIWNPHLPFLDTITITKEGAPGDFDLSVALVLRIADENVSFSLDPDGQQSYVFTGFIDDFTLTEDGDGWLSNFDLAGDPKHGTKSYSVYSANVAAGSCSLLTSCNWNIVITNAPVSPVPLPAAAWLFGSALLGLGGLKRRFRNV